MLSPSVTSFFATLNPRLGVVIQMLTLRCKHRQIGRRVVVDIAVDVMNDFAGSKLTAKLVLHPHPMECCIARVLVAMNDQVPVGAVSVNPEFDITSVANRAVNLFRRRTTISAGIFQPTPGRELADCLNENPSLTRHLRQRLASFNQAANLLPLLALD